MIGRLGGSRRQRLFSQGQACSFSSSSSSSSMRWEVAQVAHATHARRTHTCTWCAWILDLNVASRLLDWLFGRLDLCFGLWRSRSRKLGWRVDVPRDRQIRRLSPAAAVPAYITSARWRRQRVLLPTSPCFSLFAFPCLSFPPPLYLHPLPPCPLRLPVALPRSSTFHACCTDKPETMSSSTATSEGSHYTFKALSHVPRRLFCPPTPTVGAVRSFRLTPCFQVTLDDVINAKHLPPLGRKEFEEYLLFKEYSIENL